MTTKILATIALSIWLFFLFILWIRYFFIEETDDTILLTIWWWIALIIYSWIY